MPSVVDPVVAAEDGGPLLFQHRDQRRRRPSVQRGRTAGGRHRLRVGRRDEPPDGGGADGGNVELAIPRAASGRMTVFVSCQMPHAFATSPHRSRHGGGGSAPDRSGRRRRVRRQDARRGRIRRHHGGRPPPRSTGRWVQTRVENLLTMHARGHRFDVTLRATPGGIVSSIEVDASDRPRRLSGRGFRHADHRPVPRHRAYDIGHVRFDAGAWRRTRRQSGRSGAPAVRRASPCSSGRWTCSPSSSDRSRRTASTQPPPARTVPVPTLTGMEYDSGDYERCLDAALEVVDYEAAARRATGPAKRGRPLVPRHRRELLRRTVRRHARLQREYASVEILDGRVTVARRHVLPRPGPPDGLRPDRGDVLGVALDDIDIIDGDTALVPRGMGTAGSRSVQVGGTAVKLAADAVLEKARRIAAHLLEAGMQDLVVVPGGLACKAFPPRPSRGASSPWPPPTWTGSPA